MHSQDPYDHLRESADAQGGAFRCSCTSCPAGCYARVRRPRTFCGVCMAGGHQPRSADARYLDSIGRGTAR